MAELTRREFVKAAALGAAGLMVPGKLVAAEPVSEPFDWPKAERIVIRRTFLLGEFNRLVVPSRLMASRGMVNERPFPIRGNYCAGSGCALLCEWRSDVPCERSEPESDAHGRLCETWKFQEPKRINLTVLFLNKPRSWNLLIDKLLRGMRVLAPSDPPHSPYRIADFSWLFA